MGNLSNSELIDDVSGSTSYFTRDKQVEGHNSYAVAVKLGEYYFEVETTSKKEAI